MSATPIPLFGSLTRMAILRRVAKPSRLPNCREGLVSCEGVVTGLAMLFFLETVNGCLCRSVLTQMWTIPIPTPGKPEGQRFSNSHRKGNS